MSTRWAQGSLAQIIKSLLLNGQWLLLVCFFTSVSLPVSFYFFFSPQEYGFGSWSSWQKPFPVLGHKQTPKMRGWAPGDEIDQTIPMCPDLQLEAAVALGLLFLLFPGDEWNPQPAPAAADLFWKWFSSWLHLVDRVSSETKHRFLFDTFSCVEVALEGLLQDFFLVSSLPLHQAAHRLSLSHLEKTQHTYGTPGQAGSLSLTLQHPSWGITQRESFASWAQTLETATGCTSHFTIPLCNDTF